MPSYAHLFTEAYQDEGYDLVRLFMQTHFGILPRKEFPYKGIPEHLQVWSNIRLIPEEITGDARFTYEHFIKLPFLVFAVTAVHPSIALHSWFISMWGEADFYRDKNLNSISFHRKGWVCAEIVTRDAEEEKAFGFKTATIDKREGWFTVDGVRDEGQISRNAILVTIGA